MSLPHISQYGELRPASGWDLLASLGYPSTFQRVSRLGRVTARHSSSGRQPNFATLNRGRHLYSAGRPSRWALAHSLVISSFFIPGMVLSCNKIKSHFKEFYNVLVFYFNMEPRLNDPLDLCRRQTLIGIVDRNNSRCSSAQGKGM